MDSSETFDFEKEPFPAVVIAGVLNSDVKVDILLRLDS